MILWTIKLLNTAKKAIAGRKYPHQLAWATAFGLLLGIVPHGNLLAVGLVVIVLSLKINHAMAGLTAIATAFLVATNVDPVAHLVGESVLTDPRVSPLAMSAWQLPLVPWTDLNNTVVMGSFIIGVAALIPVFVVTYPLFRLFAPKLDSIDEASPEAELVEQAADARTNVDTTHQVVMVDRGHGRLAPPHELDMIHAQSVGSGSSEDQQQDVEAGNYMAVETRIDVIRMKGDHRSTGPTVSGQSGNASQQPTENKMKEEQPMDEALNYLLRQLRDSQQRSAA